MDLEEISFFLRPPSRVFFFFFMRIAKTWIKKNTVEQG